MMSLRLNDAHYHMLIVQTSAHSHSIDRVTLLPSSSHYNAMWYVNIAQM